MKRVIFSLLSLVLVLAVSLPTQAQSKIKEGRVTFAISYEDLPDEMKAFESMLPKEMIMQFKKEMSRVEMGIGVGTSVTVTNNSTGETTSMIDMMGNKVAMTMSKAEAEELKEDAEDDLNVSVEYLDESKEIAGFNCTKAVISISGEDDEEELNSIIVWFTKDLDLKGAGPNLPKEMNEIEGFPMEYSINTGEFTMMMTVSEVVKEKVSDDLFAIPADYKKMSPEEFQKQFGGMGM